MRSLYLRIYITVVAALALFALVSGWLVQRHMEQERERVVSSARERFTALGELLQRSLPRADAPPAEQAAAVADWSRRLRLPMALDDDQGQRIGESESFGRRFADITQPTRRAQPIALDDGRTLWILRPARPRLLFGGPPPGQGPGAGGAPPWGEPGPGGQGGGPPPGPGLLDEGPGPGERELPRLWAPRGLPEGLGLAALLVLLFAAVALGAWPVVRRLTRRLEALKQGVEAFGAGTLSQRVAAEGRDEVAALAASFNQAAERIEALLRSHQSLLANASHELRSPLARLKMAVSMAEDATPAQRERLRQEIHTNIAELDALVEEVLLASRLDGAQGQPERGPVNLLAVAAEEAARVGAQAEGDDAVVPGEERLLRRALRNLLENAQRYGGGDIFVSVRRSAAGGAEVQVCDRGPGVPPAERERIFEAFYRMSGHAEREGGVGLGLALVRQIAQRHRGSVRCQPREGGGSCFVLTLPGA